MQRGLLLSLFIVAFTTGQAVAGEDHDTNGDHGHDAEHRSQAPETKAFFGSDTQGTIVEDDHGHEHQDEDDGHSHADEGQEKHDDDHHDH